MSNARHRPLSESSVHFSIRPANLFARIIFANKLRYGGTRSRIGATICSRCLRRASLIWLPLHAVEAGLELLDLASSKPGVELPCVYADTGDAHIRNATGE